MRLTYANVTATVALFVALGGTGYAVTKLPANSVGSAQVRDRSLLAKDLAPGVGTRGPRGAVGPKGDTGGAGPQGPAGLTSAVTANGGKVFMSLGGPSSVDALTMVVPAGTWWILGSASLVGGEGSDYFRCSLRLGSANGSAGSVGRFGHSSGGAGAGDLLVHQAATFAAATTVKLVCGHDNPIAGGSPRVDHSQFVAVHLDAANVQ